MSPLTDCHSWPGEVEERLVGACEDLVVFGSDLPAIGELTAYGDVGGAAVDLHDHRGVDVLGRSYVLVGLGEGARTTARQGVGECHIGDVDVARGGEAEDEPIRVFVGQVRKADGGLGRGVMGDAGRKRCADKQREES
jgi:hypothetical protein